MERGNAWCILRTAGRLTLPLAESLSGDGFECWTPAVLVGAKKAPMVPTYVFAGAVHVWALADLAEDPAHSHPEFSVFRRFDGLPPIIDDGELESLRYEERRGVPPAQRRTLLPGEEVRVTCGPGAGKKGIVEYAKGKFAMVDFGGAMRVKISTFLLAPTERMCENNAGRRAA